MNPARFPRYEDWPSEVPAFCLTPHRGACLHRFFDTCPISPSGRYLALLRLPFEDRLNEPGEVAEVLLVDLESAEEKVVARTRGWEMQLGANLNWGETDRELLFNEVDLAAGVSVLVRLDPFSGKREIFPGGIYHASPDGRRAAACSLEKMVRCQQGYGVRLPEEKTGRNIGAREDDGLFITDLRSGERKLIFSLEAACRLMPDMAGEKREDWEIYGFHSKWSPHGDRILFTVRRFPKEGALRWNVIASTDPGQQMRFDVFTMKPDGSEVRHAVPAELWVLGGHHVNWFPDGKSLSMNLRLKRGEGLKLMRVEHDGSGLKPLAENIPGSGHPTVHPDGKHLLTDCYDNESLAFGDGTVPLRWIDLAEDKEEVLLRIGATTGLPGPRALRVDPHPVLSRDGRWVVFNGVARGEKTRRVFLADLSGKLELG